MVNRSDVVEIETWCQSEGRIGTRRDWILRDSATNEVIGRATRFAKNFVTTIHKFIFLSAIHQYNNANQQDLCIFWNLFLFDKCYMGLTASG